MRNTSKFLSFLTAVTLSVSPVICKAQETNDVAQELINEVQEVNETQENKPVLISAVENLNYISQIYIDNNNRIIGSYPVIGNMPELSNKILSDIDKTVSQLSLKSSDDYGENILKFEVDESVNNYAKISINIEKDFTSDLFEYFVDIKANSEIEKSEFEKAQKEEPKTDDDTPSAEITMIPLRVNAEKLGWKVDWEQKKGSEPSKAILSKDSTVIKILVDSKLDYDLIINGNSTKKLDKPAELQDSTLYVPSTFIDSYLKTETDKTDKVEDNKIEINE